MSQIDFNNALHAHTNVLRREAATLANMAENFFQLGMDTVGQRLDRAADRLASSAEAISDAWGKSISDDLAESQRGVAELLSAMLQPMKGGAAE